MSVSYSHILATKLKALKQDLQMWNKERSLGTLHRKNSWPQTRLLYGVQGERLVITVEEAEVRRSMVV